MKYWVIGWVFLLLYPLGVQAQFASQDPQIPETTITLNAYVEPSDARPGEHARVIVQGELHPGWHVYSVVPAEDELAPPPTKLTLETAEIVEVAGNFYESNPITAPDPVLGTVLSYHKKNVRFFQNIKIPPDASPNLAFSQQVKIRYQTCSDKICLPPKTETLAAGFTTGSGSIRQDFSFPRYDIDPLPAASTGSSEALNDALKDGFWGFIGLAILSGFLALLTPCVFPMIPVTVAFFTKQNHATYGQVFRLTSLFGLGIIGTYTATGMGLSVVLGATGAVQLATNGWVNLLIGVMFTVFAFSLMGFFNLALPTSFGNTMDRYSRKLGGPVGVMLMGLVFTLTSFTCTVQFVGTMLIAASQGHWAWPILGMLVFSTVFAFPFFLLGLVPRLVQSMRSQAGAWLSHTKIILGLLELAAAFKFFSNADLVWQWGVIDRDFVLYSWIILGFLIAAFLLGMITIHNVRVQHSGAAGFTVAFSFLFLSLYLFQGLNGKPVHGLIDSYLPPELPTQIIQQNIEPSSSGDNHDVSRVHELPWQTDLGAAMQMAQQQNKKVFVDFTGYTCVNCRWMEKNVFADSRVLETFEREFILVQLYTDGGENYEANQALQVNRFHTLALPFYVVLDAQDRVLGRHSGIMSSTEAFLGFLQGQTPTG